MSREALRLLPPPPAAATLADEASAEEERTPTRAEERFMEWLVDEAIRELMEERR